MSSTFSRRKFLKSAAALAALGGPALGAARLAADSAFDLVIEGGTILDGTGGPGYPADLGIAGDTIAAIGRIDPARGRRVLRAEGRQVCPGFIDIHSHSDGLITVYPTADSKVRQGVTTELTGNCGGSTAPLAGPDTERERRQLLEEDGITADWTDAASYFARLERTGISVNQALLMGQGTLRRNAVGPVDRPLAPAELAEVIRALEEGLEQGAIGLSSGLEYIPGSYTPPAELEALAAVVARRGGLYSTHLRDEGAGLLDAVGEAVELGRRTGVRVQVSHFKAAGQPNWDKQPDSLGLLENARAHGIDIMADAYPYPAYSTSLTIFLPAWAMEGGDQALTARLQEPAQRARIRAELDRQVRNDPGDYELILVTRLFSEKNRGLIGRHIGQIAASWGIEPVEAMLRLLEQEQGRVEMVGFGMRPENVEMVLSHPLVMFGSDGYSMAPTGKMAAARPHPRSYGTYPRALGHYVRERKIFDLPTAVRKATALPADRIGLRDRGRIARGMKADLVVFDAATLIDRATFENPHQYPLGIELVLVNGQTVVEGGNHTGARPGRVLRRA